MNSKSVVTSSLPFIFFTMITPAHYQENSTTQTHSHRIKTTINKLEMRFVGEDQSRSGKTGHFYLLLTCLKFTIDKDVANGAVCRNFLRARRG